MNFISKPLLVLLICIFSQSNAKAFELENNISSEQLAYSGILFDSIEIHSSTEATLKNIEILWGSGKYKISAKTKGDAVCTKLGFDKAVGKAEIVVNESDKMAFVYNQYGAIEDEFDSGKIIKNIKCSTEVLNPLIERKDSLFSSFYTMEKLRKINKNFVRWMLPLRKEHKVALRIDPISGFDPSIGIAATQVNITEIEIPYKVSIEVLQSVVAELGVSIDSYYLILCHEVSHHEKNFEEMLNGGNKSNVTSENESDWKSIDRCWNYLTDANGLKYLSSVKLPSDVVMYCDKNHPAKSENDICKRVSLATSSLMQKLEKDKTGKVTVSLTKEADIVSGSEGMHASPQCRIDILKTKMSCLLNHASECAKPKCFDI